MENQQNIENLQKEIDEIKEKINTLIEILTRIGTDLRNAKDSGAFRAGNDLAGAMEGIHKLGGVRKFFQGQLINSDRTVYSHHCQTAGRSI